MHSFGQQEKPNVVEPKETSSGQPILRSSCPLTNGNLK